MPVTLTYHGHSALALELNGTNVLIDPFIKDNPMSSVDIERLKADYILVSHGHKDHVGDTVAIAQSPTEWKQAVERETPTKVCVLKSGQSLLYPNGQA